MADLRRLPGAIAEHWDWQLAASCRGMDVGHFYHPPDERNSAREQRIAEAKKVCHRCPVIAECLDHALRVREPYGIWGGRSEDERAALLGVQSLRYPARIVDAPQLQERGPGSTRLRVQVTQ
jgi:WhiB family redox-sensing transcriptional regulator